MKLFNFESQLYLEPSKESLLKRLALLGALTYPVYAMVFIFFIPLIGLASVYIALSLLSLAIFFDFLKNLITLKRWTLVFAFWISVVSAAVVLGRDSHCHLWFLSGIGLSFLIFPTDRKIEIGLATLLTAGSYLFFSITHYPTLFSANLSANQNMFLAILNISLSCTIAFTCYVYLYISFSETHSLVITQRDALAQSSRMASLGELSSGVAHEINNPLTVIMAKAEILLSKGQNFTEKEKDDLNKIIQHSSRILNIVNSLKLFSRDLDSGEFTRTNISSLVFDCAQLYTERAAKRGIELTSEISDHELFVFGNAKQLAQVVVNLLTNAFEAVQKLDSDKPRWIKLHTRKVGKFLEIDVVDSGVGVSKEIQNRLMDPFFTTKIVGEGTGMGLSVSQGIVNQHRGTLEFVSDSYTKFRVTLPVYSTSQPTTLPPSK